MAKQTSADDPRGMIAEAYNIDGIPEPECRSIFLDWALEPRDSGEMRAAAARLLDGYQNTDPDHPMTNILKESLVELSGTPKRRGGRRSRN